MTLTILKGDHATGKTIITRALSKTPPRNFNPKILIVDPIFSIAYIKRLIKTENYNQIIIDEPVSKKVIKYLKEKADEIYQITCVRTK